MRRAEHHPDIRTLQGKLHAVREPPPHEYIGTFPRGTVLLFKGKAMRDRDTIQQIYIRICRDSGFGLDSIRAATLAAKVVGCSPLEIWLAMPSLGVMDEIATGTHPATHPR